MGNLRITLSKSQNKTIIKDNFELNSKNKSFVQIYRKDYWTIYCWGDPASKPEDSMIINGVINDHERKINVWGRSYIAINTLHNLLIGATDYLGLFPIWKIEIDNQILLVNSRDQICNSSSKIDPLSARTLLCFGQLFNNTTLWNNTKMLQGRTNIFLNNSNELVVNTYQSPILSNYESNFDDALDSFVESVRQCYEVDEQPLVSLSGGLDSRLILAASLAIGKKPIGLSYGRHNSEDVLIAKNLAHQANIPIFTNSNEISNITWSTFQRVALYGAGEIPIHHAHAMLDMDLLNQTSGKVILTGTGAEVARAFYYDRGMPGYSLLGKRCFLNIFKNKAERYVKQEFLKHAKGFLSYAPEYYDEQINILNKEIGKYQNRFFNAALFLDNFYLQTRVLRMVSAGQQVLDPYYLRSHPFLNKDALFYIAHLPVRYKIGSVFHRKAIAKLSPKLDSIVWDKTNRPLNEGLPMIKKYPALAQRIGVNSWGKASTMMFDYQQLLKETSPNLINKTLSLMECLPEDENDELCYRASMDFVTKSFSYIWAHLGHNQQMLLEQSA